jgi:hypothetical protein
MLATSQSRPFCLLVCCLKNVKIRIYKCINLPVALYGMKLGLSHLENTIHWGSEPGAGENISTKEGWNGKMKKAA